MSATYTTKEVAALLGVLPSTIQDRCASGRMFPPPVLQRPYRFSRVEVDALVAGQLRQPPGTKLFGRPNRRRFFRRAS